METVLEIVRNVLAIVGGVAVVILAFTFSRILAAHTFPGQLDKAQLESARITLSRYQESQFGLYNALWGSLYDLMVAGDALWEQGERPNLKRFTERLMASDDMINRNVLLIESEHLSELKRLMRVFRNFEVGNKTLIQLRESPEQVREEDVKWMVTSNGRIKEEYDKLVLDVAESLRRQLRGK